MTSLTIGPTAATRAASRTAAPAGTTTTDLTGLRAVARRLVGLGRGILVADEPLRVMNARFQLTGVEPTGRNRRDYRELLVTSPGLSRAVSGVVLSDETIRQRTRDGDRFPSRLADAGLLAGVSVDTRRVPLPGAGGETVTEGLDGLRDRLAEYRQLGATFAKWRAVFPVDDLRPSPRAVQANAHVLARYAAACQDQGLVPIVGPEVLMDGDHSQVRDGLVTGQVLREVFRHLLIAGVDLAAVVLEPNMVLPGVGHPRPARPDDVAASTIAVLRSAVPAAVPGVAFLSGGQSPRQATANLAAMRFLSAPWSLTFCFGRALSEPALLAWAGDPRAWQAGQRALLHRVECNRRAMGGEVPFGRSPIGASRIDPSPIDGESTA